MQQLFAENLIICLSNLLLYIIIVLIHNPKSACTAFFVAILRSIHVHNNINLKVGLSYPVQGLIFMVLFNVVLLFKSKYYALLGHYRFGAILWYIIQDLIHFLIIICYRKSFSLKKSDLQLPNLK